MLSRKGRFLFFCLSFFLVWRLATADNFILKKYDLDVTLHEDSTLRVVEDLDVQFTRPRHGIFRSIPYRFPVKKSGTEPRAERPFLMGDDYIERIYGILVPGERTRIMKKGDQVVIRIGDPDRMVDGRRDYRIVYNVHGAINFFRDHSELYWNLVGNAWNVPIEKVTFNVHFPKSITLNPDDYFVYTGLPGSRQSQAAVRLTPDLLTGRTTRILHPHEGVTVGARFPPGYLSHGGLFLRAQLSLANAFGFFMKWGPLLVPFLLFAFLYRQWKSFGREPERSEMVHYRPPEEITPAEAGILIDDLAENRDLISLIYYWAARGNLLIEEKVDKALFGLLKNRDYILHKKKNLENPKSFEKAIFDGLFASRERVAISDLKDQFYTVMADARSKLDSAADSFYVKYSRGEGTLFKALAIVALVGAVFLAASASNVLWLPSGAACALLFYVFGKKMPKKNPDGAEKFEVLRGFKEFVSRAEKPKLETLLKEDPNYFDKTLPYAVVFGLSSVWAGKFEGLLTEPPSWYAGYGTDGFSPARFADSVSDSMSSMNSAFTSAPSSSGGSGDSGFSGGGGSGGGSGGGGGGDW